MPKYTVTAVWTSTFVVDTEEYSETLSELEINMSDQDAIKDWIADELDGDPSAFEAQDNASLDITKVELTP